jgi:hypothetical protein
MSCRRLLAILIGSGIACSVAEQATPPKRCGPGSDVRGTAGTANDKVKVYSSSCQQRIPVPQWRRFE